MEVHKPQTENFYHNISMNDQPIDHSEIEDLEEEIADILTLSNTKETSLTLVSYNKELTFSKNLLKGKLLGNGGFGKVFLVVDKSDQENKLAVKEILLSRNRKTKYLESFRRESEILFLLKDHHRIVPCYGYSVTEKKVFIFMGYMKQGSLSEFSRNEHKLKEDKCFVFIQQILEGLEYLHEQKVIHRDVKGDNILLETEDKIRLSDFGVSKVISDIAQQHTVEVGSYRWMAPEVCNEELSGKCYSFQADCWSLGCTVIEMITGDVPYSSLKNSASVIYKVLQGLHPEIPDSISPRMKQLLSETFEKSHEKRMSAKKLLEYFFSTGTFNEKHAYRSDCSECSNLQDVQCTKNPGHSTFLSIKSLTALDLSKHNMPVEILELIKSTSELTVQINVHFTSSNRPQHWPESRYLYPYYNMRDRSETRSGSGFVYSFTVQSNIHDKCPCQKCFMSLEPSNSWGVIEVMTATHVVFDGEEAEHTTCRFFYDDADSEEVTLIGFRLVTADVFKNWCLLRCVTCNSDILNRVSREMLTFQTLQQKFNYASQIECSSYGFIVSHPHGGPKQINFGELKDKQILDQTWSQLTYTMSTCPGSSGAYVYIVGESGQVWHYPHVHSGAFTSGLNYSSIGYCGPENNKIDTQTFVLRKDDSNVESVLGDINLTSPSISTQWEKGEILYRGRYSKLYPLIELNQLSKQFIIIKEGVLSGIDLLSWQQILNASQNEHEILQTLNEHHRIIQYHGYKVEANCISKFMNFMPMGSMVKYYQRNGPIPEDKCLLYTSQILEGLEYLHQNDIIHMDIRAKNIFIESEQNVKISGFQHARKILHNIDIQSVEPWSIRWTAPELINPDFGDGMFGVQVDIWSLGCTIVEMITADVPYEYFKSISSVIMEIGKGKPPRARRHISEEMDQILKRIFEPKATNRPSALLLKSYIFKTHAQDEKHLVATNQYDVNCSDEVSTASTKQKADETNTKSSCLKYITEKEINLNFWKALITSSKKGFSDAVEHLVKFGADINAKNSMGWTILMILCNKIYNDVLRFIIQSGANINVQNNKGDTALMISSLNGITQTVDLLLRNGADVNIFNKKGRTALILSSQKGHKETVDLLLINGADVNILDKDGCTAIILSSQEGHQETVDLLLRNGAKVNIFDKDGWTALMLSSHNGHTETVDLLLRNGAKVNTFLKNRWTALVFAAYKGHTEIVDLLLRNGAEVDLTGKDQRSALFMASQEGRTEIVRILLRNGADINRASKNGRTALMLSSQNGHKETVDLLLRNGAGVNIIDKDGCTALILSSQEGHKETVDLLLRNGAEVNLTKAGGWTALMLSSHDGHTETVGLLLRNGAKVNTFLKDSWTALMFSSYRGHTEIVNLLLRNGAEVDLIGNDERSALLISSQEGYTEIVRALLKNGADINRVSKNGRTALMLSSQRGHNGTVDLLLKNGAEVNIRDNYGWTAIMHSSYKGHAETVDLLLSYGADVNAYDKDGWTAAILSFIKGHTKIFNLLLSNGADDNILNKKMVYNPYGLSRERHVKAIYFKPFD